MRRLCHFAYGEWQMPVANAANLANTDVAFVRE
jgi:hypothetical protein